MIVGVALATAQISMLCCLTTAHFHGMGLKTNSGPDPCSDFGAGIISTFLFRSRNRIRVLISDPEPHSCSGAGTVHEKLMLSATIHG